MRTINTIGPALAIITALAVGGCTTTNPAPYASNTGATSQIGNQVGTSWRYGLVQSVQLVQQDQTSGIGGSTIGLGTIAGAVVGGVVGNQVGKGGGNTAATLIGAAGGAYVGHELENRQQVQQESAYKITVRMDDGSYQTVMHGTDADFRAGDRVRIGNGVMERY